MDEESKRQIGLLRKLEATEEFREWRDLVAKPLLAQTKAELREWKQMGEADLKATVAKLLFVEDQYYSVFEQVRSIDLDD